MEKATVAENFSGGSKDIANSLPKGSSTSHSKSPGKENTPPYKKQRSSVKGKGAEILRDRGILLQLKVLWMNLLNRLL